MNLFCIPFAGGSSASYRVFGESIGSVHLTTLELPGRGSRTREPALEDLNLMATDLLAQIRQRITDRYAFYGHSMGAALAWMLTRQIQRAGERMPEYLFVSGRRAPSDIRHDERYLLPQKDFFEMLKSLGGCPQEVLDDPELLEFFEPILRADFRAVSTFVYEEAAPFDTPIVAMIGNQDEISKGDADSWQAETTQPIVVKEFSGDHFFILEHHEEITRLMFECLTQRGNPGS